MTRKEIIEMIIRLDEQISRVQNVTILERLEQRRQKYVEMIGAI